ncbi:class I SAM-dependent methyltransferase [Solirubrobacter soli]|uniref:class I SAM-dependent methyltransferase n=1 Tax=Solirubrobacter soli TaxID=363832 RepID=UPI00040DC4B1|nr:class I SAM-dependent methyltransferase [Solirubrobacter soli]
MTTIPYATGRARADIERALGNRLETLQPSDLALLEDFHSLGRLATVALVELAQVSASDRVLDAGTGIGGTARLIAAERGAHVTAVDITPEYCDVAAWLNDAVGLGDRIDVRTADVTALPFEDASFDVIFSQHVQMNIADKHRLYAEARRVLAPGGRLALWDVTAGPGGPIHLPVPWATAPEQSHLVTPEQLNALLTDAGFAPTHFNDLTEPAGAAMRELFARDQPPLGLHVFLPDFPTKAANLGRNLAENRARLIQAVCDVAHTQRSGM